MKTEIKNSLWIYAENSKKDCCLAVFWPMSLFNMSNKGHEVGRNFGFATFPNGPTRFNMTYDILVFNFWK